MEICGPSLFEKGITIWSWGFCHIGCGWGLRNSEGQVVCLAWSFDLATSTQTKILDQRGASVSYQISLSLFLSTFLNQQN